MKIKRLCNLSKKDIDKHWKEIADILRQPTHVCRNCCRVANHKKRLCNPEKLAEDDQRLTEPDSQTESRE